MDPVCYISLIERLVSRGEISDSFFQKFAFGVLSAFLYRVNGTGHLRRHMWAARTIPPASWSLQIWTGFK